MSRDEDLGGRVCWQDIGHALSCHEAPWVHARLGHAGKGSAGPAVDLWVARLRRELACAPAACPAPPSRLWVRPQGVREHAGQLHLQGRDAGRPRACAPHHSCLQAHGRAHCVSHVLTAAAPGLRALSGCWPGTKQASCTVAAVLVKASGSILSSCRPVSGQGFGSADAAVLSQTARARG